ncbi:Hypothetical protein LUCI_3507 [Lucifera butyrica]|uniref:Uncharacterized protein n=1 Tax=Lucifera butyrica TaxID=1351585 RepID=A0A498RGJ7_9FIRM|nr:Hypothetical protein LUCI_3507 [Lucifera butyrica]
MPRRFILLTHPLLASSSVVCPVNEEIVTILNKEVCHVAA